MRAFLDVIEEGPKNIHHRLIHADVFDDLNKMLSHLVNNYSNIINLRQLDEEDKDRGDLYFEVYVKKAR